MKGLQFFHYSKLQPLLLSTGQHVVTHVSFTQFLNFSYLAYNRVYIISLSTPRKIIGIGKRERKKKNKVNELGLAPHTRYRS